MRFEPLEERQLLAVGPQLIGINPNQGDVLEQDDVLNVAPQELTFRFDESQVIDPSTLDGIRVWRAGPDKAFGTGDEVVITPGFVGIGERPNEVVVRFADSLPDDRYRVAVLGAGPAALTNISGQPFNGGLNQTLGFELDLGAQVISVVPQPTGRDAGGTLRQARDQIVVYFNDDDLHPTAVTTGELASDPTVVDPQFYQLIFTNETVTNTDDLVFNPSSVSYDPAADSAVLTFAGDLANLPTGAGTYRLRIGTNEPLPKAPTTLKIGPGEDPGSSFDTAHDLGILGAQSQIIQSAIDPELFPLEFPGANDEPGHREIPIQNHLWMEADALAGIRTQYYNFRSDYGFDPLGNPLKNLINPAQKQLAREIFDIFGSYLGIQFVETDTQGLTVVTGDMRALNPTIDTGPGGDESFTLVDTLFVDDGVTIMDNAENWDDTFGGNWFTTAFGGIASMLGLNETEELPPLTVSGEDATLARGQAVEPVFPGDHDIVHGRHLYRPEANDIDLFRFTVQEEGVFTAETFAERLQDSSTLDTVISLYKDLGNHYELISRNDDYFSEDSFVEITLTPGTYAIGVTSSGNREFDPSVEDTGLFGTSDGPYDLRLDFRATEGAVILDTTGTALDGDGDGIAGGEFNFWFRTQTLDNTIFVDKSALGGPQADGGFSAPYRTLVEAFSHAQFGQIVRVVGNGGADGNLQTTGDNLAYLFGFDELEHPLEDGATVKVPHGVTVMVDAGAIFKAQDGAIEVGSSAPGIDRSGGALQVLGTPDVPVFFTSYNDEIIGRDTNPVVSQTPSPGDWGGIIFRDDIDRASPGRVDYEAKGIFLNYVNHADMRFAGGRFEIDSRERVVTAVEMVDARPTITFNSITHSADAALAASPDSFEETSFHAPQFQATPFTADYDRVGPEIHGNQLFDNTINGLFVRIRTPAGEGLRPLKVAGRFDDTDVVHVLSENLVIQGTPGGPRLNEKTSQFEARLDARLAIDPGTVVKLGGAHIQVGIGAQLIAEGVDGNRVILTSLLDDTFGASGNFDTTGDGGASAPGPGDWGGIYFGHISTGSIDHAHLRYGGGVTRLKSESAGFNLIEIQQADVRLTNSILEYNAVGTGGQAPADRFGLLDNAEATIFVRGAQPVIVDNIIRHSAGPAININVNSLNSFLLTDFGRSTGSADRIEAFADNQGPLVRNNRLLDNSINGMQVRGATLTTGSVWDDTDIAHVLLDEVIVPDFHTFGGLRLESSPNESLVVKLSGPRAGFTAAGRPLDIDDRIGGMLHIIGQPGSPVVITSLADDTVAAGVSPDGTPNGDTNNDGTGIRPAPGDWRSIRLEGYSHDRNVAVYTERESPELDPPGSNGIPDEAEFLGLLAPKEKGGDENRRLGFEVHGYLPRPGDVDVYSFEADAGTEVWLDIDRTSQALDTVVELIDSNGAVVARSDNSLDEGADSSLLVGIGSPMQKLPPLGGRDYFTTNPKDAGMRLVLPGAAGTHHVYHVRVRSSSDDLAKLDGGDTAGSYQLNIRLRELDELAGSNVRFADIRYATNGIEVLGQPIHSPLLGEAAEDGTGNNTRGNAQDIGNVLETDRAALSVAGDLGPNTDDIDFYRFEVTYQAAVASDAPHYVGTVFDVDYSDGLARGDITLSIFDSQGRLILVSRDGGLADDFAVGEDSQITDLSRGSLGPLDPFLGTVELEEGEYFAAVSSASQIAKELDQFFQRNATNPLVRLEPIDSLIRIAEDHIGSSGGSTAAEPVLPVLIDQTSVVPFFLGDTTLFVSQDVGTDDESQLLAVDPFSGAVEVIYNKYGRDVGDIAMRYGGRMVGDLFGFTLDIEDNNGPSDGESGNLIQLNTSNGGFSTVGDDGITTYRVDPANNNTVARDTGIQFQAMTFGRLAGGDRLLAIGNAVGMPPGVQITRNILYHFDSGNGSVLNDPGNQRIDGAATDAIERGEIVTATRIDAVPGSVLLDGTTFTIEGVTFEFEGGPQADVDFDPNNQNQRVQDGEFFEIDGQVFEFDTDGNLNDPTAIAIAVADDAPPQDIRDATVAEVNNAALPATAISVGTIIVPVAGGDPLAGGVLAGDEFVLNDNVGSGNVVFQFTKNGLPGTGDVNIDISDFSTQDEIANLIDIAVANAGLGLTPVNLGGGEVLLGGVNHTLDISGAPSLTTGPAVVIASTAGTRVNFFGAAAADFSGVAPFTDLQGAGGTNDPGAIVLPFLADDTVGDIARQIRDAVNDRLGTFLMATVNGTTVTIVGMTGPAVVSGPLVTDGAGGPGGTITGMTILNGQVFAVSDTGGLWQIFGAVSPNAFGSYIAASAADLQGINFAGLTTGPSTVEGGLYADLLFGITEDGTLYAFDTTGELQPIFLNGATSVQIGQIGLLGLSGVQGLAFSSLGENLWHITDRRGKNAGHGISVPFDSSRTSSEGGLSFYFGRDYTKPDLADYNTPGGAFGTLISNPFDLSEYAATDEPVLYFNYFAVTEGVNYNPNSNNGAMRDAFRVYISDGSGLDGSGQWHLLATNDSFRSDNYLDEYDDPDPFDSIRIDVQELYDFNNPQNGTWRQVRIPLDDFAGRKDIRLRFEFSSAGSMNFGDPILGGGELRAVAGSELRDGDTFAVDGTTFEFDSGYTIVLPGGAAIFEGDALAIDDDTGRTYFEFDNDGAVDWAVFVPAGSNFSDGQTFSITDGVDTELFELNSGYSILLPAVGGVGIGAGEEFVINDNAGSGDVVFQFTKNGLPGTGEVNIEITDFNTQDEVADLLVTAIENAGLHLTPLNLGGGEVLLGGLVQSFETAGPLNLGGGYCFLVPATGGVDINAGDEFVINDNAGSGDVVFQFTKNGLPGTGEVNIEITDATTADEIADLIVDATRNANLGLTPANLGGGKVFVGGIAHTFSTSSPLGLTRGYSIQVPGTGGDHTLVTAGALNQSRGYSILVPATGGAEIDAGDEFIINDNAGSGDVVFQFTKGGLPGTGEVNIAISDTTTQNEVADLIVTAINNAGLGLTTANLSGGKVLVGGVTHTFNASGSLDLTRGYNLQVPGAGGDPLAGGIDAGDQFVLNTGSGDVVFQFTKLGLPGTGDVNVDITDAATQDEIADLIVAAIESANLGLAPVNLSGGRVLVGGLTQSFSATGPLSTGYGYSFHVPASGGDPSAGGIDAGDEFFVNDGTGSDDVVFRFKKDGLPNTGDYNIGITDATTQDEIADRIVTAINAAGLGLVPANAGEGVVFVGAVTHVFEVPPSLTLGRDHSIQVPGAGGDPLAGGIAAGDQFVVNDNAGSGDVVFEFTKGGLPGTGDVNIEITDASTQNEVADLIVTAISGAGLGLTPLNLGGGKVLLGGMSPLSERIAAGDQFVVNDGAGSGDVVFQFTRFGVPGAGDVNLEISDLATQNEVADLIVTAINDAGLGVTPVNLGSGKVQVGGVAQTLDASAALKLGRAYSFHVPVSGGDPAAGGLNAGDEFVVNDSAGSGDVVFQFTKAGLPGTGDVNIEISDASTQDEIAQLIVTAVENAGLGLAPVDLGSGEVLVGGVTHTFDTPDSISQWHGISVDLPVSDGGHTLGTSGAVNLGRGYGFLVPAFGSDPTFDTSDPLSMGRGYGLLIPAAGGDPLADGVAAGDRFVVNDNAGSGDVVFEFTKGGLPGTGDVNIEITDASTQDEIAGLVVAAIENAGLGLAPVHLGGGEILLGAATYSFHATGALSVGRGYSVVAPGFGDEPTFDLSGPLNMTRGYGFLVPPGGGDPLSGGIAAGEQFVVNDNAGSGDVVFEFTKSGLPGTGDVNIEITDLSTQDEVAQLIVTAIGSAGLGLTPVHLGGGEILLGSATHTFDSLGSLDLGRGYSIEVPPGGGDPLSGGVDAGDQFVVNDNTGSGDVVFEFTKGGLPGTGDVNIEITDASTQDEIADLIATAVTDAGLALSALNLGGGEVLLGGIHPLSEGIAAGDQFVINDNIGSGDVVFQFTGNGLPGTGDVSIEISNLNTQDEIADLIVTAIENAGVGLAPVNLGGGQILVGGTAHTLDATGLMDLGRGFSVLVPDSGGDPLSGGIQAGDQFVVNDIAGGGSMVFQFTKLGLPGTGDVNIEITDANTQDEIADLIVAAVENSTLGLAALNLGGGQVVIGGVVPLIDGIDTGDEVIVKNGSGTGDFAFQFAEIGAPGTGDVNVVITDLMTRDEIGDRLVAATNYAGMGLTPANLGGGKVFLGGITHVLDTSGSVNVGQTGEPGLLSGGVAVNFIPSAGLSGADLAATIAQAINSTGLNLIASAPDFELMLEGDAAALIPGTAPLQPVNNTPVSSAQDDASANIAARLELAIRNSGLQGVIPYVHGNRINLENATNVSVTPGSNVGVDGQPGIQGPAAVPVPIHEGMTSVEVATAIAEAMASALAGFDQQILTPDGSQLSEGEIITIDDGTDTLTVEFDSGYTFTNPAFGGAGVFDGESFTLTNLVEGTSHTLDASGAAKLGRGFTILVPGFGGDALSGGIDAGDQFVINDNAGSGDVVFQFTKNGLPGAGDVNIEITDLSTQDEVADLIVDAINNAGLGLSAGNLGGGSVLVEGVTDTVDASGALNLGSGYRLLVPGSGGDPFAGGVQAGDQVIVHDNAGGGDVIFQFTKNGSPGTGDVNIPITELSTQNEIADLVVAAIENANLGLTAANLGGDVFLGGTTHTLDASGSMNVWSGYNILVPGSGGDPLLGGIDAGDEFIVDDNTGKGNVVFQFTKNGLPGTGDVNIAITDASTQDEIADLIVAAIKNANPSLTALNLGGGNVFVGGVSYTFDMSGSANLGRGNALLVPVVGGSAILGGIAAGDQFVLNDNAGSGDVVFQFTKNGLPGTGDVNIEITNSSSQSEIADMIVAAIENAGLAVPARNLGGGKVVLGGIGATFEFDNNGVITNPGNIPIKFDDTTTADLLGVRIADAIAGADVNLAATHLGAGVVHVGGTVDDQLVNNSSLLLSGRPGVQTAGATVLDFFPDRTFTADQTAIDLAAIINGSGLGISATATGRRINLVGDNVTINTGLTALKTIAAPIDTVKRFGDIVQLEGHTATAAGTLGLANSLYGDQFGAFNSPQRAQNNNFEGIFIDDLIVGPAKRGEMATDATQNTDFRSDPQLPDDQILEGPYQFEIRRAAEYGVGVPPPIPTLWLTRSFDPDDRLTQAVALIAPSGAEIADGQSFNLGDGLNEVTFVFDDVSVVTVAESGDVIPLAAESGLVAGSSDTFTVQADVGDWLDVDFFAFDLAGGDKITIDIDAQLLGSSLDSVLRLFDANGAELAFSDDAPAPGEGFGSDSFISYTALAPGRYFVAVSGFDNSIYDPFVADSGFGLNSTGTYQIELLLNGGQAQAGNTIPFTNENTAAEIANRIVAAINSDDVQEVLDVQATSKPYATRVDLWGSVTLLGGFSSYSLAESNDTLSEAVDSGIVPGESGIFRARGDIGDSILGTSPNLDVDLIQVELSAGDTIAVDIDAQSEGSSLDSVLRLFDADGVQLMSSDDTPAPGEAFGLDSYLEYTAIADGTFFVGVSGFANFSYDPNVAASGSSGSTGFYNIAISRGAAAAAGIGVVVHDEFGDTNRFRDQGQLLIESNFITDSAEYGIVVDADQRGGPNNSPQPHQGPVRTLVNINEDRLVPGATILNNVIAFSGTGGLLFSGDTNPGNAQEAPVPYGRILNNTIYGTVNTVPPSLPPVSLVPAGPAVPMFGVDSDLTFVPAPGVIPNDDLSSAIQNFGFTFEFYGNNFTQFYINNNGNISFTQPLPDYTPSGFPYVDPMTGQSIPMVAPFWANVDTRPYPTSPPGGTAGSVRLAKGTTLAGNPFVQINWVNVGYFDTTFASIVPNLGYRNNFSLYIEDNPAGDIVAFDYGNMGWTTGEVDSPAMDGFGGQGAQIGFDAGNGSRFLNVARPKSQADLNALRTANNGQIVFQMDPSTGIPVGSGGGIGIQITNNASPTVLNNILANLDTGLDIDNSSQSTVLGGLLFQDNQTNSTAGLGHKPITLAGGDPLFVNPIAGNFYLDIGSQAIDSALKSLEDRPEMIRVREPLGIDNAPVLAPEFDVFGSFRSDDPDVKTPPGMGETVFLDRGAIDRVDFDGPMAELIAPPDGDGDTFVQSETGLREFLIQLNDDGLGVADNTVNGSQVVLQRDGGLLVRGEDYTFRYDRTNSQIRLAAGSGIWTPGVYHLVLDNSDTTGIKDVANNPLQANQQVGTVEFTVAVGGGTDYGDAPDPSFPTLRPGGASHDIVEGFFLGYGVDADSNGKPSSEANNDAYDDGIRFDTALSVTGEAQVTIRASAAGRLDAWIDYDGNGVWDAAEQIFAGEPLDEGLNTRTFTVPSGILAKGGESFARFRFSSAGGLSPGGPAGDGEVEDYRVQLETPLWRNPTNYLDVNGDGVLAPQDALYLSSFLYFHGQSPLPDIPATPPFPVAPPPYYDVNGDNFVGIQDALIVVAALRNQAAPEGEGERLPAQMASPPSVFPATRTPSVTLGGMASTSDRGLSDGAVANSGTISGKAVDEPTVDSSNATALPALFLELNSRTLSGSPASEPAVESSVRAAAAVDQIMARSSAGNVTDFADIIDFADDGWSTAAHDGDANALDDLFAQLEDVGELLPVSFGDGV